MSEFLKRITLYISILLENIRYILHGLLLFNSSYLQYGVCTYVPNRGFHTRIFFDQDSRIPGFQDSRIS